jgi:phosphomethylpyrimidine synthase
MADIDSRLDKAQAQPIGVTTGPIRGSRKIHVATQTGSGIRVAMREIDLDPHSGEPRCASTTPRGPYTDANATIDINAGLPRTAPRLDRGRGDVEGHPARGEARG